MKDEYLIWKRVEESLKKSIEESKAQILVNERFLDTAIRRIGMLPKPKLPPTKKPIGTG